MLALAAILMAPLAAALQVDAEQAADGAGAQHVPLDRAHRPVPGGGIENLPQPITM